MPGPSNPLPIAALLLVVLAIALVRSYRMAKGAPADPVRLLAFGGVYVALFLFVMAGDTLLLPLSVVPVELALLAVGAIVATRYVRRVVVLTRGVDGGWSYRLGLLLPSIYLGLLGIRLVVDLSINPGGVSLSSPGPLAPLTGTSATILFAVNLLFAVSAGLLVGRSVGIYLALRDRGPVPPSGGTPPP